MSDEELTHILEPHGGAQVMCKEPAFRSAISADNSLTLGGPIRCGPIEEHEKKIYCRNCIYAGMLRLAELGKR